MSAGVITKLNHLEKELHAHFDKGYVFIGFKSTKEDKTKAEITTRIDGTAISLINALKVLSKLLEEEGVTKQEKEIEL